LVTAFLLWPGGDSDRPEAGTTPTGKPATAASTTSGTPTASASATPAPTNGVPAAFAGTWTGTVNDNLGGSFTLTLTVREGTTRGTFAASGGSLCNQPISFTRMRNGSVVLYLVPANNCGDGTITLTQNGANLTYRYESSDASITADADLTKTG
ncbi:hypothetical protein, partial [Actinocorallia lasiicapitis]